MRILAVTFLLICSSYLTFGQTREAELENVKNKYEKGEISADKYERIAKEWKELLEEFDGYPELPYNKERKIIQYEFIKNFPNLEKETIYNRILEWAAINFGSLDAVLHYKNYESGKIILKGIVPIYQVVDIPSLFSTQEKITETKCHQTYVFTLKNNKLKLQIQNIAYEQTYYNYSQSSASSSYTADYSIHNLYPITNFSSDEWKNKLNQLVNTDEKIRELRYRIFHYIEYYKEDYNF